MLSIMCYLLRCAQQLIENLVCSKLKKKTLTKAYVKKCCHGSFETYLT